jgi:hypothetical protein
MNEKLSQIFKGIEQIEPEARLEGLILQKIDFERDKQIKRKLFLSYAGLVVSFAAVFPAILKFGSAFLKSEFWSIFLWPFPILWRLLPIGMNIYIHSEKPYQLFIS